MANLDAGRLVLDNLMDLRPEEACLKAVTEVLGVPHHVYFVEVTDVGDGNDGTEQVAVHDPHDRLGDVQQFGEGRLMTVRLPGHEARYVTVVVPFAD